MCTFQGPPTFPKLDFGLWARVFSAVLLPLEPTIPFSHCSAVSHPKTRDFRFKPRDFRWRHFRFRSCDFRSLPVPFMWLPVPMSPRSYFHTGQRFPILKHVTSGYRHFRSLPVPVTSLICSRPIRSQHWGPYGRTLLLLRKKKTKTMTLLSDSLSVYCWSFI